MPAQLVALDNGPSILLDKPILLLGRHPECDIQIDSRKISRRHCCIAQVSDYLVVRDLGSTNGIRINGTRIVEGRLNTGDELTIGNYRYKVSWDSVAGAAALPPVSPQSPSQPAKGAVRKPSPLASIEDEMLESSDEPVPLDEPGANVVPVALPPPPVPEKSFHLPDELELLPNSGHFHKDAPPPSPSGIHPA
ncbi:MAG TPA: FHA domain-containing protein [Gemmataceae bacterium]|nr:FHA domain-containing protein [Gemmataceae bacterium]